jgi:hypothetical protein
VGSTLPPPETRKAVKPEESWVNPGEITANREPKLQSKLHDSALASVSAVVVSAHARLAHPRTAGDEVFGTTVGHHRLAFDQPPNVTGS